MIKIATPTAAFEAIAATLPPGSVPYEPDLNAKGDRMIWIQEIWRNKLDATRGPASLMAMSFFGSLHWKAIDWVLRLRPATPIAR